MDSRYRFLTSGTPWTQSMPSHDVNAVTRLAEASWWRDKADNRYFQCIPVTDFCRWVLGLKVCRHVMSMLQCDWLKLV